MRTWNASTVLLVAASAALFMISPNATVCSSVEQEYSILLMAKVPTRSPTSILGYTSNDVPFDGSVELLQTIESLESFGKSPCKSIKISRRVLRFSRHKIAFFSEMCLHFLTLIANRLVAASRKRNCQKDDGDGPQNGGTHQHHCPTSTGPHGCPSSVSRSR